MREGKRVESEGEKKRNSGKSYSMAERSMSTSSPFIKGIFFFLFLEQTVHTQTL